MSVAPPVPPAAIAPAHQPAMLRSGAADDLDAVMAVMDSAFEPRFGEAWTRSQCAGIMPMAGVALRLAEDGAGEARGFSLSRIVADEAELLLLAVAPAAQRSGIGRLLLEDFVAQSAARDARRLHLEVRDGNPAVELYHAAGFELAGRRTQYYHGLDGESSDALTLVRLI